MALLATLCAGARADAADVVVRAEVDAHKIGVEDQLQLTISVEGSLEAQVAVPPLTNLQVVGGPFVSTQVSIVNGRMSQKAVHSFVLKPVAVGPAEVGPVKLAGQSTEPIAIQVGPGRMLPERRTRPAPLSPFGEDPFEGLLGAREARREPKLFVEAQASRRQLHVGEPLLLTYHLYTQATVTDLRFVDAPQYPGFWSEELERSRESSAGEAASVAGDSYRRFAFLQRLLYPTRAGSLSLPAATVQLAVQAGGGFFGSGSVELVRRTKPIEIRVDPLPQEPGFTGAVGTLEASAELDRNSLPLGEAATLRFRVKGTGNLKWIDRAPALAVPGAKVYPPQVKSDLQATPAGIRGSRTWEFVLVPETSGALEIPPLDFAFFDPAAGRIVRTSTPTLPLHVEGGAAAAAPQAPQAASAASRAGGLVLRSDLDRPAGARRPWSGRTLALLLALALLLHAVVWIGPRFAGPSGRRATRVVPRRQTRAALADLARAASDGMSKETSAAMIEKSLVEVFGPLEQGEGEESQTERAARDLLAELRFLRYAPQLGDYSEKVRDVAERAAAVIRRV